MAGQIPRAVRVTSSSSSKSRPATEMPVYDLRHFSISEDPQSLFTGIATAARVCGDVWVISSSLNQSLVLYPYAGRSVLLSTRGGQDPPLRAMPP